MRIALAAAALTALTASPVLADEGDIVRHASNADVPTTVARLVDGVEAAGATVFATVDHGKGAASVEQDIGQSQLVIFGNPKVGTPVMQQNRLAGLMLPLQVLVYEDAEAKVWVAYEDMSVRLGRLDEIDQDDMAILTPIAGALDKLSMAAATGE